METFKLILITILGLVMIVSAIMAILSEKMPMAILASGAISLLASIFFLALASPDVAMTEAAIGAGLTTFLFFIILRKTEQQNHESKK
jgi:energy-converting hydrogenase B subunit D